MKIIYLFTLTLFISVAVFAQETDSTKVEQQPTENKLPKPKLDKSRMYYGGYVTGRLG